MHTSAPSRLRSSLAWDFKHPRKRRRPTPLAQTIAILLAGATLVPSAGAADGTWIKLLGGSASGLWSDALSWAGGQIADGAGATANFSTVDLTLNSDIQLDTPRTIGSLIFGDADPSTPANWSLANNSTPANVLTLSGASPTISVTGGTLTLSTVLAGTEGLTYAGPGTVLMQGGVGHTYTGGTILKGRVETTNLANVPLTIFGAAVATNTLTFDGGFLRLLNTTGATSAGGVVNNIVVNTTGTLEYSGRSYTNGTLTGSGVLDVITHYVRSDNGGNWSAFAGTINVSSGDLGTSDFRQTNYNGFAGATLNLGNNANLYFTPNQANTTNPYGGTFVEIGALSGVSTALLRGGPQAGRVTSFRIGGKNIDSEYAGRIVEQGATGLTNVVKNGTGTLTLSGTASSYGGPTTINSGTLAISVLGNGGTTSSIGQSSNAAANLLINGGRLRYLGSGSSSDRLFTIGALGGTLDASGTGPVSFTNAGPLVFTGGTERTLTLAGSNTGENSVAGTVPDDGAATHLTKTGAGSWVLSGANTYSGITSIQGGVLSVSSLADGGLPSGIGQSTNAAGSLVISGGTLRYTGASASTDRALTVGAGGATLDASGSGAITFSNPAAIILAEPNVARTIGLSGSNTGNNTIAAPLDDSGTGATSLVKSGPGTWALSAASSFTGGTTVTGGLLRLNNTTGSGLGTGAVLVSPGGSLGGLGSVSGGVTVNTDGRLSPGDNGVGTLTVGNLSISPGAIFDYEFALNSGNDLVAVTLPGGLTLNGAGFNLFAAGSTTRFTNPGTYNLLQYNGALGGTGTGGLSVLNPQSGLNYAFGSNAGFVTLTISTNATLSNWTGPTGGSWNSAGNWSSGIPNGRNDVATFGTVLAGPGTITLDGSKTVGTVQFDNANSYTVAPGSGGTLVLDSGASTAQLSVLNGSHTIAAPVTLASSTIVEATHVGDLLRITGNIGGSGTLTKQGPGTLALSGVNSFANGTTVAAGTLEAGSNAALGTGPVNFSGSAALRAGADGLTLGNSLSIGNAATVSVDTAARELTLSGVISSASINGGVAKVGAGTLTVGSSNTYSGVTTISAGVLRAAALVDGGLPSSIGQASNAAANLVIDGGTVRYTGAAASTDRTFTVGASGATLESSGTGALILSSTQALALPGGNTPRTLTLGGTNTDANTFTPIFGDSGTGATSLVKAGIGTWRLAGANTFTGNTSVQAGSLILDNPLALERSTLDYTTPGGTLAFGSIFAATLGGLAGNKALPLENEFLDGVALTVGVNNQSTTYEGVLSGFGSLTKVGTGVLNLGGVNTYGGTTTIAAGGGALKLLVTDAISSTSFINVNNFNGLQLGDGVTLGSSITAATGANEFVDVPDGGAVATLSGAIGVAGGGNQFRLGVNPASTLRVTGSVNIGNAGTITFITRGNIVFAGSAAFNSAPGITVGRSNQTTNLIFQDSSTATIGGGISFGGNQPNPSITMTLKDEAVVNAGAFGIDLNSSSAASNQTTLNLSGGTLTAGGFFKTSIGAAQFSTLNFNGGTLRAGASSATYLPNLIGLTAHIQGGGARIDTAEFDITIVQPLVSDPLLDGLDGGLTKLGIGTLTLAGENTFIGPARVNEGAVVLSGSLSGTTSVRVRQGSLTLGGADRINDTALLVLAADATFGTGGFSETLGALSLEGGVKVDLGLGASILRFADSSSTAWSAGRLTIAGWSGSPVGGGVDQLFFGNGSAGLNGSQIAQVRFENPDGFAPGEYAAQLLGTGELVAVPEPATAAMLACGIGSLALRRRRKFYPAAHAQGTAGGL